MNLNKTKYPNQRCATTRTLDDTATVSEAAINISQTNSALFLTCMKNTAYGIGINLEDDGQSLRSYGMVPGDTSDWSRFNKYLIHDTGWIKLNNYVKYRQKNGICFVKVNVGGVLFTDGKVIGTLPKYPPEGDLITVKNAYGNQNGKITINTSGQIIYNSNIGSTDYIRADLSYPFNHTSEKI